MQLLIQADRMTEFKIQATDVDEVRLLNQGNVAYTGPVYFGTPLQGSPAGEFIYDTGSSYTTVTTVNCTTCNTTFYDPYASSTFANWTSTTTELAYNDGREKVTGYTGEDRVCLST